MKTKLKPDQNLSYTDTVTVQFTRNEVLELSLKSQDARASRTAKDYHCFPAKKAFECIVAYVTLLAASFKRATFAKNSFTPIPHHEILHSICAESLAAAVQEHIDRPWFAVNAKKWSDLFYKELNARIADYSHWPVFVARKGRKFTVYVMLDGANGEQFSKPISTYSKFEFELK